MRGACRMSVGLGYLEDLRAVAGPVSHILIVWLLAWLLLRAIRRLLLGFRDHIANRVDESSHEINDSRRLETLTSVLRYTANITLVGMAGMLTLSEFGISISPLLATAGVAGIAIGFGAQSLVKDFFSGLFLLLENQVSEGDFIEAAGKAGQVESVTLRHIRMRDYDGSVHFIPNGMITTVTNRSREYAYAVIDLAVPQAQQVETVFAMMREVGAEMRADSVLGRSILADVDIAGVEKLDDTWVVLRCRLKSRPARQWRVRREFLRRMKSRLEQAGVEHLKS
jgi:moderate conductance mechanosensitive channel